MVHKRQAIQGSLDTLKYGTVLASTCSAGRVLCCPRFPSNRTVLPPKTHSSPVQESPPVSSLCCILYLPFSFSTILWSCSHNHSRGSSLSLSGTKDPLIFFLDGVQFFTNLLKPWEPKSSIFRLNQRCENPLLFLWGGQSETFACFCWSNAATKTNWTNHAWYFCLFSAPLAFESLKRKLNLVQTICVPPWTLWFFFLLLLRFRRTERRVTERLK